MGRFNENPAWKEFIRWAAVAGAAVYIALSLAVILLGADPFTVAVMESLGWKSGYLWLNWIFRIGMIAHTIAVVWLCLRTIEHQDGDWPN